MAQPDYQKGDNIMYSIYNHTTGQYGTIYRSLTAARAMAHAYSLWAKNDRDVIDMQTGEVMSTFEKGKETYRAKG
jgi:hypothetical protein